MEEGKESTDYSDDERLKDLIREALAMRVETRTKQKKQRNLNETLGGVVGEFLSSFIVMGYDLSGNPVTLKLAPTTQHNEALKSLLIRVFAKEIRPGYGIDEEPF